MSEYKPVPVSEARRIAEEHAKDQVLIFAWDRESGLMHTTTYGKSQQDREMAAQGGDRVAALLSDAAAKFIYEDFRIQERAVVEAAVNLYEVGGVLNLNYTAAYIKLDTAIGALIEARKVGEK